jgi:hypothetical protein
MSNAQQTEVDIDLNGAVLGTVAEEMAAHEEEVR